MTPLVTPAGVRLVLTREAVKILGCSMRQVRMIALEGKVKCWPLGLKSFAYDIEDVKRYKDEKEAGREIGKVRGSRPQGFSTHVGPSNRKKE
jgi:hypothetical protein